MKQGRPVSIEMRCPEARRQDLLKANVQLQAHVAALVEDNRQLRAALRMFSEVARREPSILPLGKRVA